MSLRPHWIRASLRTKSARFLGSRLGLALGASTLTALVIGGVAIGTPSSSRSLSRATAVTGYVIGGNVQLIDAAETTSFIGLGGFAHTAPGTLRASSVVQTGGVLSGFSGLSVRLTTGSLTFTVFVNSVATPVTCTIATGQRSCTAPGTTVIPPDTEVSVQLQNATGSHVTDVRWSALVS